MIKTKIILALMLSVAITVLTVVMVVVSPEYGVIYESPSGENPNIEVKNSKYFIDGEQLEYKEGQLSIWDSVKRLAWYIPYFIILGILTMLLIYCFGKLPPPYKWRDILGINGKPSFGEPVTLQEGPSGLIGVRVWRYDSKRRLLKSTAKATLWNSNTLESDMVPNCSNWKGIHAYRLGSNYDIDRTIGGIVCLTGRIVGHGDSMLRSERCQILALITDDKDIVLDLAETYKCPVFCHSKPSLALLDWSLGNEGLFWMQHNNELIDKRIRSKMDGDIETVLLTRNM